MSDSNSNNEGSPKLTRKHRNRKRPIEKQKIIESYSDIRPKYKELMTQAVLKGTTRKHNAIRKKIRDEFEKDIKDIEKKTNKKSINEKHLAHNKAILRALNEDTEFSSDLSDESDYSINETERFKYILNPIDTYSEEILSDRLNSYKKFILETIEVNKKLVNSIKDPKIKKEKLIRQANIPEDISENIAKYIIRNKLGKRKIVWAKMIGKTGDLILGSDIIEVKAFTSDGPSSFGPKKIFDIIYFLDLRKWLDDIIILWEVSLNNKSSEWKHIKLNEEETHEESSELGKRPHISWENIKKQIPEHKYKKIFEGSFKEIFEEPVDKLIGELSKVKV